MTFVLDPLDKNITSPSLKMLCSFKNMYLIMAKDNEGRGLNVKGGG